jgi:hypothetical protein
MALAADEQTSAVPAKYVALLDYQATGLFDRALLDNESVRSSI